MRISRTLLVLAVAAAAAGAHAEPSPAKKDLITRILKVQQPGIEALARDLAEEPAAELLGQAAAALPARVAADKRDAVAKEIQADARKYAQEAVPIVRSRALAIAPTTIGTLLDEKFSEEELKQVVAMLESPTYAKFQQLGGDMQKVLTEKLVADTRSQVTPKVKALEDSIGKRLGVSAPAGAASAPKAPAKK